MGDGWLFVFSCRLVFLKFDFVANTHLYLSLHPLLSPLHNCLLVCLFACLSVCLFIYMLHLSANLPMSHVAFTG